MSNDKASRLAALYKECADAARAVADESQAIEILRQAINADPLLALMMAKAARRSAVLGLAAADEAIPV